MVRDSAPEVRRLKISQGSLGVQICTQQASTVAGKQQKQSLQLALVVRTGVLTGVTSHSRLAILWAEVLAIPRIIRDKQRLAGG